MNSTNWPAANVWVFMAQLVESAVALIDCEQSLFFFRFSKGCARPREC